MCSSDLDNIIGVLHIWDVTLLNQKEFGTTKLGDIARKPFFANSNNKISDLLIELRKNVNHMAIVTNQDEQVVGLITVEDLLEEIVGDIVGESR